VRRLGELEGAVEPHDGPLDVHRQVGLAGAVPGVRGVGAARLTDAGEQVGGEIGRHGVAGIGNGEEFVAPREQLPGRVRGGVVAGAAVPRDSLVEASLEQLVAAAQIGDLMGHTAAGRIAQTPGVVAAPAGLLDVARHPRGVAADGPHDVRQRAAIVRIGGGDALRPGEDVGTQAQERVVEQRTDEAPGELGLVVVEEPAQRRTQLREGGVDLAERIASSRVDQATVGSVHPLDEVVGMAFAGRVGSPVGDEPFGAEGTQRLQQDVPSVRRPHDERTLDE
jgi:hypothetical protein